MPYGIYRLGRIRPGTGRHTYCGMYTTLKSGLDDILRPIAAHLERVDAAIGEQLRTGVPLIDESSIHLFTNKGKMIRASLIILASGMRGRIPEGIIDIAAAAEIVHAATLIHDDIIDNAEMRRGDVAVSRRWGNKVAVLVGDHMYTRALEVAVRDDNYDLFPELVRATADMVKGELLQIEYSNMERITAERYFEIIELKTARFLGACAKLGAIKAGLPAAEADALKRFGVHLGFAFQIVDDTLDCIGDERSTGKDSGNDYLDAKATLPLIHALEAASGPGRDELVRMCAQPAPEHWPAVREALRVSGALARCLDIAREYARRAVGEIDGFPDSECKRIILRLSDFLLERAY